MPEHMRTHWDELPQPFLRLQGRDLPAAQQLRHACRQQHLPITPLEFDAPDQTLIDPSLPLREPNRAYPMLDPNYRPTFATLSPEQRWFFWNWLRAHEANVPVGYAILYIQHLEAALFDIHALAALEEMRWLLQHHQALSVRESVTYDLAMGAWLHRQLDLFTWVIYQGRLPSWSMEILLFLQNDLGVPLSAGQAMHLGQLFRHNWSAWSRQHEQEVQEAVDAELAALDHRFLSQQVSALPAERRTVQIQLLNPGLRFTLPAPEIWNNAAFQQAVKNLLEAAERSAQLGGRFTVRRAASPVKPTQWVDRGWYVVLEFGESSSEKLNRVVTIARRHPGFMRLLDENREIVYRTVYQRRDLNKFWTLFDRVRTWKSTRVFINGNPTRIEDLWPGALDLE